MSGIVKPAGESGRPGKLAGNLAALRLDAGLHLGLGLALVAGLAWTGERLLNWPGAVALQAVAIFVLISLAAFLGLPKHLPARRFGAANRVTLARAVLVALFAGLVGREALLTDLGWDLGWFLAALAGVSLALDGLDGWTARRRGTASRYGARFDMELDAFFILVLAALVHDLGKAGAWVLLSGGLRYIFFGLGLIWPPLRRPLPVSRRRQTICVAQTVALVVCLTPLAVPPFSTLVAAGALALLVASFAADLVWLGRRAHLDEETRKGECP